MKSFSLSLLLCLFILLKANAQVYFGYSANTGDFEGINESIDFWNTNFELEATFRNLKYIHGFTLKYGDHIADSPIYGSIGNSFMIQKTSSTWNSTTTGQTNKAEIRYMRYAFQLGAGFRIINASFIEITPGINLGMDLVYLDYRFSDEQEIAEASWDKGVQELQISKEVFLQFDFRKAISIMPYVLILPEVDTTVIDRELLTGKQNGKSGQNQVGIKFFLRI